ncbi:uncharacterized protein BO80DRAFT_132468 [Aspergillus ibericus CBS 121593]|uniref:Uncharacterized protein n=1 Tax=Aspergillus ibericus CBS 121593 TaxID=1448316 RepID=A0A395HC26_9EURO|nr:hypothetical protein BO80DRAFT_132468 [Aspergillus ibericus CBS 121593]RAL05260.1 hypothetical protein BO80DRAFT_132468 [Aspergillus ibericus CBS 121593]
MGLWKKLSSTTQGTCGYGLKAQRAINRLLRPALSTQRTASAPSLGSDMQRRGLLADLPLRSEPFPIRLPQSDAKPMIGGPFGPICARLSSASTTVRGYLTGSGGHHTVCWDGGAGLSRSQLARPATEHIRNPPREEFAYRDTPIGRADGIPRFHDSPAMWRKYCIIRLRDRLDFDYRDTPNPLGWFQKNQNTPPTSSSHLTQ